MDLKLEALRLFGEGHNYLEVASRLNIPPWRAGEWLTKFHRCGLITRLPSSGRGGGGRYALTPKGEQIESFPELPERRRIPKPEPIKPMFHYPNGIKGYLIGKAGEEIYIIARKYPDPLFQQDDLIGIVLFQNHLEVRLKWPRFKPYEMAIPMSFITLSNLQRIIMEK